jgi:3-oxocholest-4-en-26-oate---CoA ligase
VVLNSLWFVDEIKRSPAGESDYGWAAQQTEVRPPDDVLISQAATAR